MSYTIEQCDEQIKEITECIRDGAIDKTMGEEYIDFWLDYRLEVMEGGVPIEDPTLAGQSARRK